MKTIELKNTHVISNTDLYLHAESTVRLLPGTRVHNANNHVIIKAGNVCIGEDVISNSKYEFYYQPEILELISDSLSKLNLTKSLKNSKTTDSGLKDDENPFCSVYPNPNNGTFYFSCEKNTSKKDLMIYDLMGRELKFSFEACEKFVMIKILENYTGIAMLSLINGSKNEIYKVVIE